MDFFETQCRSMFSTQGLLLGFTMSRAFSENFPGLETFAFMSKINDNESFVQRLKRAYQG